MQQGLTATCKDCGSEPMAEKSRGSRFGASVHSSKEDRVTLV